MGTKAYLGYTLYNVNKVTNDIDKSILIWSFEGGSLVSKEEFISSFDYLLKEARKKDEFHHWLDWKY